MKKIYIILTYTGTILSKIVKVYTRKEYSHVSISLDEDLTKMYSFGRLYPYNPFLGGFVHEGLDHGTFKRFKKTKTKIYSLEIPEEKYDKIEEISLLHKQRIPQVEVKDYKPLDGGNTMAEKHPTLYSLLKSENKVERYWVNKCLDKLDELKKFNNEYLDRLEEEARVKKVISEKLETNMFAYPVTLQHYVDLFWDCGSIVGAGRGSSCSGLNHYLLGITQLDPIKWNLPFWRYLNDERVELGCL